MLRKDPHDWEALYRRGVAAANLDRPDVAAQAFRACSTLTIPDDETSAFTKARAAIPTSRRPTSTRSSPGSRESHRWSERLGVVIVDPAVLRARQWRRSPSGYSWSPADFGQARIAAMGWLVEPGPEAGHRGSRGTRGLDPQAGREAPADLRAMWDWFYLCAVRFDNAGCLRGSPRAQPRAPTDPLALWAYLHSLGGRQIAVGQRTSHHPDQERRKTTTPPLETGRARPRARLLPLAPGPASRAGRRPRSSSTWTTS